MQGRSPNFCAKIRGWRGSIMLAFRIIPIMRLAQKYFAGRSCSLLTFGIRGGFEAGKKFYNALKLFMRLVNLGDAKSLACHPASTTHRQMSPEEQRKAGVSPEMIRLSIGIEHFDDIIADLDQALEKAVGIAAEHRGRDIAGAHKCQCLDAPC